MMNQQYVDALIDSRETDALSTPQLAVQVARGRGGGESPAVTEIVLPGPRCTMHPRLPRPENSCGRGLQGRKHPQKKVTRHWTKRANTTNFELLRSPRDVYTKPSMLMEPSLKVCDSQ